jgi:hypothetical protein
MQKKHKIIIILLAFSTFSHNRTDVIWVQFEHCIPQYCSECLFLPQFFFFWVYYARCRYTCFNDINNSDFFVLAKCLPCSDQVQTIFSHARKSDEWLGELHTWKYHPQVQSPFLKRPIFALEPAKLRGITELLKCRFFLTVGISSGISDYRQLQLRRRREPISTISKHCSTCF